MFRKKKVQLRGNFNQLPSDEGIECKVILMKKRRGQKRSEDA